jgi:KDO2-lipid IV(A) lauroyltransferase
MIDGITYRLIHFTIRMMSYFPYPVAQFKGKGLGIVAYLFPMSRKKVALENIKQSFGGITEREAKRLLRKVYMHFGRMFFEIPHITRLTPENLDHYVTFEGRENLERAIGKGNGVFVLTAHFGNWELMAAAMAILWNRSAVVVRPADFGPLDRVTNELRAWHGTDIIPKQRAMRQILNAVRENKLVGILLDQNVDWYEGAFVPFLGRWACTNKGLALIALRTGTPVIPAFPIRQKDGRYLIILEREIGLQNTGHKTADVEANTEIFTRIIEKYVKEYPDHWFWFHKRWKTKNYCPLPTQSAE